MLKEDFLVTILILVDGFLQYGMPFVRNLLSLVTILILVDGFLQYRQRDFYKRLCFKSQSLF